MPKKHSDVKDKIISKCEGPKRYGHTDREAEILKMIRYMGRRSKGKIKGRTYQDIADELILKKIRTRQGKNCSAATVFNVLKK